MARILKEPLICAIFILLFCIRYEYNTESSRTTWPGLSAGVGVLCIVGIVLMFRIYDAVEKLCVTRGWVANRIDHRYDMLILIAFLAVFPHAVYEGEMIEGLGGETVPRWVFQWSDDYWAGYFTLAVIVIVLLIRILELVRALETSAKYAVNRVTTTDDDELSIDNE